jgi:purine nucleosidase
MKAMNPLMLALFLLGGLPSALGEKRLVLIDQDGSGPGGSNQMSAMVHYALLSIMLYMA